MNPTSPTPAPPSETPPQPPVIPVSADLPIVRKDDLKRHPVLPVAYWQKKSTTVKRKSPGFFESLQRKLKQLGKNIRRQKKSTTAKRKSPGFFESLQRKFKQLGKNIKLWIWLWCELGFAWHAILVFLAMVIMAVGYWFWRGDQVVEAVNGWRATRLVTEAAALAQNSPVVAEEKLREAALLAPGQPAVLRGLADLSEPKRDATALHALWQLLRSGEANPQDRERLSRLALDWDQPGMADAETLEQWAATKEDTLTPEKLRLSALWLISRGQLQPGIDRLRRALAQVENTPAAPHLEITLASALLRASASTTPTEQETTEPLNRLFSVLYAKEITPERRMEAAQKLADYLLVPDHRHLLTPARGDLLQGALTALEPLLASSDPTAATTCALTAVNVELITSPSRSTELIDIVLQKALAAPPPIRLLSAQWLQKRGLMREALSLCEAAPQDRTNADWLSVQLEALLELGDSWSANQTLTAWSAPLPPLFKPFYFYRIDRSSSRSADALPGRRAEMIRACSQAEATDILSTAEALEKTGDRLTALGLYTTLRSHPRAALPARLGMARCLEPQLDRTAAFVEALASIVQLWPQSSQIRQQLVYLRLLEARPPAEDLSFAASIHQQSPSAPSARVLAALAQFRQGRDQEAATLLEQDSMPWAEFPPGWQVVYAAVLLANGRPEEAQTIETRLATATLRPEERALFETIDLPEPPPPPPAKEPPPEVTEKPVDIWTATSVLEAWLGPLPPLVDPLFCYLSDVKTQQPAARLANRRADLIKASSRTRPQHVLFIAETLEHSGNATAAFSLFNTLKNQAETALAARLGMVRCLETQPTRTTELIDALTLVTRLSPLAHDARSQLIYLSLLEPRPAKRNLYAAAAHYQQSPKTHSRRVMAAFAKLHLKDPAAAITLLEKEPLHWESLPPTWAIVHAAALAANNRQPEAQPIIERLRQIPLRPEEQRLLESIQRSPAASAPAQTPTPATTPTPAPAMTPAPNNTPAPT